MSTMAVITCHTGFENYVTSDDIVRWDEPAEKGIRDPEHKTGEQFGRNYGSNNPYGVVTTKFLGVTKGGPRWKEVLKSLTTKLCSILGGAYVMADLVDRVNTISYRDRLRYHYVIGIFSDQGHLSSMG